MQEIQIIVNFAAKYPWKYTTTFFISQSKPSQNIFKSLEILISFIHI
jgi:hypothetical protein